MDFDLPEAQIKGEQEDFNIPEEIMKNITDLAQDFTIPEEVLQDISDSSQEQ